MNDADARKNVFLNRRDWGTYLAALQSAAAYPTKVMKAVRTGQAWFSDGASHASTWLMGRQPVSEKFSAG
jgi:hypothetical protein